MLDTDHPLERLVRKLGMHCELDGDDEAAIRLLPFHLRSVSASTYLLREGEPPSTCGVIVTGYAYRQKLTGDGKRQICSLHLPGEPLDLQSLYLRNADHNIQALTDARIAFVPRSAIQELIRTRPGIASAVMAYNMVESSIQREWMVNIGRRDAREKLAHLLCEFALRIDSQGLRTDEFYTLPMTQEQLGDALGLTAVHVNRTLKVLAAEGLLKREGRNVIFPSVRALQSVGDFNRLYLHLDG